LTVNKKIQNPNRENEGKTRIKDIARLAGVSIGTVDRVLHNRGEVSGKTRERIMRIIKDLNYSPDILARRLATHKKCRFGILFPKADPDSSFWKVPLEGARKAMEEISMYNTLSEEYLFDYFDRTSFSKNARDMIRHSPQGVILAPVYYEESFELAVACKNLGIPYIFINSNIDIMNEFGFVGQDSFRSGYLAARLISYGLNPKGSYCVINLARALNNHKHILSRQRGFEAYFHTMSMTGSDVVVYDIEDTGETEVNRELSRIFESQSRLNGVFVTNSRVFKVARFLKTFSGKSIRLLGYDLIPENIEFLEDGTVDFLISQKPFDQGYLGIRALFNLVILKKTIPREHYLPIAILTRENYHYHKTEYLKEGIL
jgi:LacI family transcriptional regulator